jgi:hypothetical protein
MAVCMHKFRAIRVQGHDEGYHGTSDPQLWISYGDDVVGKTSVVVDSVSPVWPESEQMCVSPIHSRVICIDIRDDWPTEDPLLLNQGCHELPVGPGDHEVSLSDGAKLMYSAVFPPPPAPPPPPPFNLRGKLNPAKCDAMLRDPANMFRQMWEVRQFMRRYREGSYACWDRKRDKFFFFK